MNMRSFITAVVGILVTLSKAGVKITAINIPPHVVKDGKLKPWLIEMLKEKLIRHFPLENLAKANFVYKDQNLFLQGVHMLGLFLGIDIKISLNRSAKKIDLGTKQKEILLTVHFAAGNLVDQSVQYNEYLNKMIGRKRKLEQHHAESTAKKTRSQSLYSEIWKDGPITTKIEGDMLNKNPHPDYLPNFDHVHKLLSEMSNPFQPTIGKLDSDMEEEAPVNKGFLAPPSSPLNNSSVSCLSHEGVENEDSLFNGSAAPHYLDLSLSASQENSPVSSDRELDEIVGRIEGNILETDRQKKRTKFVESCPSKNINGKKCLISSTPGECGGVSKSSPTPLIADYSSDDCSSDEEGGTVDVNIASTSCMTQPDKSKSLKMQSADNIETLRRVSDLLAQNKTQTPEFVYIEKIVGDLLCWLVKVKTVYIDPVRECNSLCGKHCLVRVKSKKPAGRGSKVKFDDYKEC
jgi:hypothetical protein